MFNMPIPEMSNMFKFHLEILMSSEISLPKAEKFKSFF